MLLTFVDTAALETKIPSVSISLLSVAAPVCVQVPLLQPNTHVVPSLQPVSAQLDFHVGVATSAGVACLLHMFSQVAPVSGDGQSCDLQGSV